MTEARRLTVNANAMKWTGGVIAATAVADLCSVGVATSKPRLLKAMATAACQGRRHS